MLVAILDLARSRTTKTYFKTPLSICYLTTETGRAIPHFGEEGWEMAWENRVIQIELEGACFWWYCLRQAVPFVISGRSK